MGEIFWNTKKFARARTCDVPAPYPPQHITSVMCHGTERVAHRELVCWGEIFFIHVETLLWNIIFNRKHRYFILYLLCFEFLRKFECSISKVGQTVARSSIHFHGEEMSFCLMVGEWNSLGCQNRIILTLFPSRNRDSSNSWSVSTYHSALLHFKMQVEISFLISQIRFGILSRKFRWIDSAQGFQL